MAIASGLAGALVRAFVDRRGAQRRLTFAVGAIAIAVGIVWVVPVMRVLV